MHFVVYYEEIKRELNRRHIGTQVRSPGVVPVPGPCRPGGDTGHRTGPGFFEGGPTGHPSGPGFLEVPPATKPDRFFLEEDPPVTTPDRVLRPVSYFFKKVFQSTRKKDLKGMAKTLDGKRDDKGTGVLCDKRGSVAG